MPVPDRARQGTTGGEALGGALPRAPPSGSGYGYAAWLVVKFFTPDSRGDDEAAEAEWTRYLDRTPAPANTGRVHRLVYKHDGRRFVVVVGEQLEVFARRTGPRGGYIKDADFRTLGERMGSPVAAILDPPFGNLLYVWSYSPSRGWANPSLVGRNEVESIEYFDGYGHHHPV